MTDLSHRWFSDGKYNSTAIVKKEFKEGGYGGFRKGSTWWEGVADDTGSSMASRYLESEYSTSYNPDESMLSLNESYTNFNDTFPLSLNPLFDLQALVMVSNRDGTNR